MLLSLDLPALADTFKAAKLFPLCGLHAAIMNTFSGIGYKDGNIGVIIFTTLNFLL